MLSRGLKYNPADANNVDFLENLESILQGSTISEDVCSDIRNIAASQLRSKNATYTTTTNEKRAINSLKKGCNITILPADKGGATVVFDTDEYEEMATQQLSDVTA